MQPDYYDEAPDSFSTDELRRYIALLWYWSWLIVLAGVLAGLAGFFFTRSQPLVFESSTILMVNEAPSDRNTDYTSLLASERLTETYAALLKTEMVLQQVSDLLGLEKPLDELAEDIAVDPVRDTQLIQITISSTDPEEAARIANTLVGVFTAEIESIQSSRFSQSKLSLQSRMTDMEAQIQSLTEQIETLEDDTERDRLDQKLNLYEGIYAGLLQSFEQIRLVEAQSSASVAQVQPATIPEKPAGPSVARNTILAIVVGAMLVIGTVFFMNALDDTIKDPDEVRRRFDVGVLGVIETHKIVDGKPITEAQPRSLVAESFRALRTNLMYTSIDKPLRKVIVTSPTPQLGKTTVLSNLGVVVAHGEKMVVLVDADMRRPQLHSTFGFSNMIGLSNLFMRPKEVLLYGSIQNLENPNLAVITSGSLPPNPAELLTSKKMGEILEALAEKFDLVLIDTPPVLTVTDAAALAPAADGVLVVIKPGVTRYADLQQTLDQIRRVGGRVLGVVFNEVNPKSRRYGYYYTRYYTRYSYGEERKRGNGLLGAGRQKADAPARKGAGKRLPIALFKRR